MKDFLFYQDVKVVVWARRKVAITAETEEDALKFIEEHGKEDAYYLSDNNKDIYVYDNEYLTETEELMSVEENGGCSTIEWTPYGKPADVLYDNV